MCFTKNSPYQRLQKATKDIVVYKRMEKHDVIINHRSSLRKKATHHHIFISPFQDFRYEAGKCYYEDNFVKSVHLQKYENNLYEGLHSYGNKQTALDHNSYSTILLKCIIPEGAYYMKNDHNELISDYLIIGKVKDIISY